MSNRLDMSFTIDFNNRESLKVSELETAGSLAWLNPIKQTTLEQFKLSKLPNRKVEHWKYNEMTFLKQQSFKLNVQSSLEDMANLIENSCKIELDSAIELIFVDGILANKIENLELIDGLTITAFNDTNQQQQQTILSQISAEFNQKNLLINLNESINQNGVLIEVAKGHSISTPIYMRHFSSSKTQACLASNKVTISLAESSQLTVIEQFESENESSQQLSLQQSSVLLADNSRFNHYRLNLESDTARQVSQVKFSLGKDSVLNSFYLGLGSELNRTDIDVFLEGENSEVYINGIYLPAKSQSIDYHTNIEHRVPHCNSKEVFRGIIADQANATFNGRIHILPDAQKSDAYLNNKNLLLTNQATINTKPELEIYADDVVCAHGATVAQLNDEAMFYMQTRGLSKQQSTKILSIAFVQELLNQIKLEPIKEFLSKVLEKHMSQLD